MTDWIYTLRERFTPTSSDGWCSYLSFSGFAHINELVTLDSMMCPNLVTELLDEDWNHNIHEDFRINLFRDLDYLMDRQPLDPIRHQVLAALERPDGSEEVPVGFTRCGFDIMDSYVGNSTLTNCGPSPTFHPSTVNHWGLLDDSKRACRIRDNMRKLKPDDAHLGNCEVWLVARKLPGG